MMGGLEWNPTDFRLHLAMAEVELAAAHPQEAEAAALRGLATKPDCAELWLLLAKARRNPAPTRKALALNPAMKEARTFLENPDLKGGVQVP